MRKLKREVRVITFKISSRELEMLDKVAKELGISRSEFIRMAIRLVIFNKCLKEGIEEDIDMVVI